MGGMSLSSLNPGKQKKLDDWVLLPDSEKHKKEFMPNGVDPKKNKTEDTLEDLAAELTEKELDEAILTKGHTIAKVKTK